ncbi:MAG: LacI family DNA-binding transcriptional regulator [Clostridia bacterium]
MVNIKDVADKAGVSVATVSRVLNQTGRVSDKSREKVLAAAQALGYQPSLLGRHLRCNRTNIVLVMLSSLSNTFCAKVIRGIEKAAQQAGYRVLIAATGYDREIEQSTLDLVRKRLADGVIVLNSSLSAADMQDFSAQFPLIQCCEYADALQVPYISIDNFAAGYEATSHLIGSGRRRIAFLGVEEQNISSRLRQEGYQKALADHGLPFDSSLVFYSNYGYRHTLTVTEAFIEGGTDFDAVFAISDTMAAAVVNVLKRKKRRVPEAVAVVGFDNTEIAYMTDPDITTIAQPQGELGRQAFAMLAERMNGRPAASLFLPHKLVKRTSA